MTVRADHIHQTRPGARVADIRRYLPSAVLAGYGVLVLSLFARGDLTLYINPTYVPWTTLGGVVLLLLAAVRLFRLKSATCDCDDGCCDTAPSRSWTVAALAFPLVLAALFPPRGLAAFSANQRGLQIAGLTAVHSVGTVHRVSLSVDTRTFDLQDWVGALSADPNPRDYLGKPIRISGLVVHSPASVPPGYIMVLRYQVTCCIADARPEGLIVRDSSHGALRDNQWVTVTGTMSETTYQGDTIAVVNPESIRLTKPGNPYMY